MDDTSWRARLAKSNINILDIHDGMVFLEFTYHPKVGVFKWCKTMFYLDDGVKLEEFVGWIETEVLKLRRELED